MYLDIGDYGIIGNGRTAALVGKNGSIDWACFPYFHSPSVFGAILDDTIGGRFAIDLVDGEPMGQQYQDDTNVLETTMESDAGTIEIVDFMPQYVEEGDLVQPDEIHRLVRCTDGTGTIEVEFEPRFDYARGETELRPVEEGCIATHGDESLSLVTEMDIEVDGDVATGRTELDAGDELWLVSQYGEDDPDPVENRETRQTLEWTREYWRLWSSRCPYSGQYQDAVRRSALVLKLLAFESTGALVAAATTSLPEKPGGARNWDYRFNWIRDAVFSAWSLNQLDYHELGIDFLDHLRQQLSPTLIPPVVDVHGEAVPDEVELDHLEGYRGNDPVRIGNEAGDQEQWDSYGAMIDGMYFSHRKLGGVDAEQYRTFVKPAVEHVSEIWDQPDHGIWEVRGGKRHFTTSKVWCWVALDRGIKIARGEGFRDDVERWKPVRESIRRAVMENGWSEDLGAFSISYDNEALDASTLLFPLVGFLPADHPKMKQTIDAIEDNLRTGPLLYRYRPEAVFSDPIESGDSAFTTSSFWLVADLARMGRVDDATDYFESLLDYANHLGLYAEELDPHTGEQLGNVPQAYVHMGVINAAVELERAKQS
ncbi:MAG: glycoside hydrolase family 15 protein [Halodesulfurarchaeum sp.]